MNRNTQWDTLLNTLKQNLHILPDKPEETPEATLNALWLLAAGQPVSVQKATNMSLPQLTTEQTTRLENLIKQRIDGVPLAHLTGRQQFMGVELLAGPQALVPRKETELLGFGALELLNELARERDLPLTVLDICTGAGNLAVAISVLFPDLRMFAADLSQEAVALARKNVAFHHLQDKVQVEAGDLLQPFDTGRFHHNVDLLLCNPPYISSAKVKTMPDEISRFEPNLAFDGGPFGIKILGRLIKEAPLFLNSGGWLGFEVGLGQGEPMRKRLQKNAHFDEIRVKMDAQGNIRALFARRI